MDFKHFRKISVFSIRKFSVGVASVLIGSSIVGGGLSSTVLADEKTDSAIQKQLAKEVKIYYVDEEKLTAEEKSLFHQGLPQVSDQEQEIYLIYKPNKVEASQLPQTGDSGVALSWLMASGVFLVVGLSLSNKKKKSTMFSVLLLTTLGQSISLPISALDLSSSRLEEVARYDQTISVTNQADLEKAILNLSGYAYVGYIKGSDLKALTHSFVEQSVSPIGLDTVVDKGLEQLTRKDSNQVSQLSEDENQEVTLPTDKLEKEPVHPASTNTQTSKGTSTILEQPTAHITTQEESVTSSLAYSSIEQENPDLAAGERRVLQAGQAGEETIVYRVSNVDGEEVAREEISRTVTKEAVPEIIEVGTKEAIQTSKGSSTSLDLPTAQIATHEESVTSPLAYSSIEQANSDLAAGERRVRQAGQAGEETIVYRVSTVDGEEVAREEISRTVTKEAVPEIIEVGTKESIQTSKGTSTILEQPTAHITTQEESVTSPLAYSSIEQANSDVAVGERRVRQAGQAGEETIVYRVSIVDGEEVAREEISRTVTKAAVPEIIEVGTKESIQTSKGTSTILEQPTAHITTQEESVTTSLAYSSIEQANSDLVAGERRVLQAGQAGEETIVYRVSNVDGEEVAREEISRTVTKEAVPEIIEVGTKESIQTSKGSSTSLELPTAHITTHEETVTSPLAYSSSEQANSDLAAGERRVRQAGQAGEETIVYRVSIVDGEEVAREEISRTVTKEAVPEIIEVGTKAASVSRTKVVETALQFETQTTEVDDLAPGQEVVDAEGVDGKETKTYHVVEDSSGTVLSEELISTETIQPVTKVVRVGKATDKTALVEKIADAENRSASDYEPNGWQDLQLVLTQARAVVSNESALQRTIDQARDALVNAIAALGTDKTALFAKISEATNKTSNAYSSTSWTALETALTAAQQVLSNSSATQSEIDAATNTLTTALAGLTTDKTALSAKISEAGSKTSSDYSSASWSTLQPALTAAQQVLSNSSATQSEIDAATNTLTTALAGLTTDKTALSAKISEAGSKTSSDYSSASWSDLQTALTVAQQVSSNAIAKQSEIDAATNRLSQAISALVPIKTKPSLTLATVTENLQEKSATVRYRLSDPDQAYTDGLVRVYKGSQKVKEVSITNLSSLLDNLEWNVPYEIETIFTYDLGNGAVSETLSKRQPLELVYKQIDIKSISDISLVKLENGKTTRVIGLETIPTDLSSYLILVKSDKLKDILLPVSSISDSSNAGNYKVTSVLPDLQQSNTNLVQENVSFEISKLAPAVENRYTSFKNLVESINANPSGTFILAADMSASELTVDDNSKAYITSPFTGSLLGNYNGKQYTIYDLKKPLFDQINGGSVTSLNLVDAEISSSQHSVGILANQAKKATITDIAIQGDITAPYHIGGLVYEAANNSHLSNVSFKGNVTTQARDTEMNLGGLVGKLSSSSLSKAYGDITITTRVRAMQSAGGAIGLAESNSTVNDVYVEGSLNNAGGGRTGGFIGNQTNSKMNNVITAMKVTNGGMFSGMGYSGTITQDAAVQGVATGSTGYNHHQMISQEVAKERLEGMQITATTDDQESIKRQSSLDYSTVENYQSTRSIAYANAEKLTPLYSGNFIVSQGNKLDPTSKLASQKILSLTPMVGTRVSNDLYADKEQLNRLMVHYEDGTIAYLELTPKGTYQNVGEYAIAGTNLIYTPAQFLVDPTSSLSAIISQLEAVDIYSDTVWALLGKEFSSDEKTAKKTALGANATDEEVLAALRHDYIDILNLETSFNEVKANLASHLKSAIAQSQIADFSQAGIQQYLTSYLEKEGLPLLLGISYMNRLYNIQFGDVNIKDLATYHQDFFGAKVNHLDWLASVANTYEKLHLNNNVATYDASIKALSGKSLRDYLSAFRQSFTTMTEDEWFKSATKAYVVDMPSKERPDVAVSTYEKLWIRNNTRFVLPMLTLTTEGVFAISNMSTLAFGMFDRHMDMSLKESDPAKYAADLESLKQKITQYAGYQRDHFDMWYRVLNDDVKDRLYSASKVPVMVWDGYNIPRWGNTAGYWMPATGTTATARMKEFFGPLKWFRSNGLGAYATGSEVYMIVNTFLNQYGNSTFTHEMVHNFDGEIYLGGYGRRDGIGAEGYALGLLQTPTMPNPATKVVGINSSVNFGEVSNTRNSGENAANRLYNLSPDRFKQQSDIQEYLKRSYDVIYTLDLAEADKIVTLSKDEQKLLLKTLEATKPNNAKNTTEIMRPFTDEEWNTINLNSLDALIDNSVIMNTQRTYRRNSTVGSNGYDDILLFAPLYSAHTNDTGASSTLTFKQTAWQMWAEGGYETFLNYASNKLKAQAQAEGQVFSDKYIISKSFDGKYSDFAEFRKAIYQERLEKVAKLKPITFVYEGKNYENQTYDQIKALLATAVERDVAQRQAGTDLTESNSKVQTLKEAIYRAYLFDTDDFRSSVYTD